MTKRLNPNKLKIGYIILIATRKFAIEKLQRKAGYGYSSKWTKEYEIKVLKRKGQEEHKRYKVALWWATMNNLPYDVLQFFWFPLSVICGKIGFVLHSLFSSRKRFLCSELISAGFYKEGDYLFNKPQENVLPADFDNPELFEEVKDIWLSSP